MPQVNNVTAAFGGHLTVDHPAAVFIKKYHDMVSKGYKEKAAFEHVSDEMSDVILKQKEDMRMLRGVALNSYGMSYVSRVQQIAEMESAMKVKRFERDIPKYQRAQEDWQESFNEG